jgi:hypothetical protein
MSSGMFSFETPKPTSTATQVRRELAASLDEREWRTPDGRRLWFAGLDPGKKGCLAVIDLSEKPAVIFTEPWPVLDGKGFTYDLPAVWKLIQRLQAANVVGVALEQQQAYPKQGASSNFVTGCGYGMLQAFLTAAEVPFEIVHSSTWKRTMKIKGQGDSPKTRKKDGKLRSIATCQSMFPGYDLRLTPKARTPSDGVAESLLLATYAGRHLVWND